MEIELDVLSWQKKTNKNNLFYTMRELATTGSVIGMLCINGANMFLDNPLLHLSCLLYDAYELPYIISKISASNVTIFDIIDELKKTKAYNTCFEKYYQYIEKIAIYLETIGICDSIQACMYISSAMRLGYFSKEHHCEYKIYKYDPLFTSHVLGARVLQGEYVCRHATKFLNDILTALDYSSVMLSVRISKKTYNELNKFQKDFLSTNHAISLILDQKGKYAFDITNYFFANCIKEIHQLDIICDNNDKHFLLDDGVSYLCKDDSVYKEIIEGQNMSLTLKDIALGQLDVFELIAETHRDLENFYRENLATVEEIASLEEQIAPRSNQLIKKWVIK